MIDRMLSAVTSDLNGFLQRRTGARKSLVELSSLANPDGSVAFQTKNQVLCTLVNIEQERASYNMPAANRMEKSPPVQLSLDVLFAACYEPARYMEALKMLSYIIGFFQAKHVFTSDNTSQLPVLIDKLTVEPVNLELKDLGNFWSAVGIKHQPTVIYKMRILSVTEDIILEDVPSVQGIEKSHNPIP
ncbi:MAG: DUF4255 domain-containing protein [Lewinella sp.]|nr:DUF4255 domain-containing protein [Lewinella sp.]